MANIGLELLMENLKQLICYDSPSLMDNPFVRDKQPQFQLLYQEIESLRTFVMVDRDKRLARRLRDVVNEAEYIVDLFMTNAFIRNNTNMTTCGAINSYQSPNFDSVMEEIKSIKKEFMDKKMQSQTEILQPTVGTLPSRNITSAVLKEEIIVGLDDDLMVLLERLTGNQKQLEAISIVGMGGLGKTTLATKVFNDQFIVYHFHVRAWVTVSQAYTSKKDLLISLLTSIGKRAPEEIYKLKVGKISELLYKSLKGKRYLIVIDDLWSAKAWDDLKMYFPNDNTRSRILLTTRLSEIAVYANPHDGEKLLEEVAEDYLIELTDRSLLIVAKKGSNSGVKVCRIHDILRQLCLRKAAEENFFQQISKSGYLSSSKFIPGQQRRLFADSRALSGVLSEISSGHSTPHICLFLCFNKEWYFSLGVQRCFHPFLLLRVLDPLTIRTSILPLALELLIHLRHLALWYEVTKLPLSVCNLWNLQTLTHKENYSSFMKLPENIAKMVNLRQMWIGMIISIPDIHNPSTSFPNFSLLDHLETLKVIQPEVLQAESMLLKEYISFPLLNYAFEGPTWDTREAYNTTFPCLTKLVLLECYYLKGIPEEVGEIPILEMIDIDKRNHSLVKSTTKIREQHHTMGNYELKIHLHLELQLLVGMEIKPVPDGDPIPKPKLTGESPSWPGMIGGWTSVYGKEVDITLSNFSYPPMSGADGWENVEAPV
ncbi:disease resistance protein [Tanacetum coccineum]|uniref:Disease resistance protein n=1 Tax=Tanacetum coccineum TaxID=301880 RepID=A0ABQ5A7V2_9ASTR